ncbi:hypothetical protein [Sphingopyxis sp. MG]|uniref:hypothetical protein n=1 Tax=Sphingopyxis sp. MG TaxID=1866325 RepID=UPI001319F5B0|nr:hypothetical protein [Sphingopyxis sp. MG]
MKDEATPEQSAMARRIVNANSNYMDGLDRGQCNFSAQEVMQIALAAIIETTERAAAYLSTIEPDEEAAGCPASWGDFVQIAQTSFRAGKHYGKDPQ